MSISRRDPCKRPVKKSGSQCAPFDAAMMFMWGDVIHDRAHERPAEEDVENPVRPMKVNNIGPDGGTEYSHPKGVRTHQPSAEERTEPSHPEGAN